MSSSITNIDLSNEPAANVTIDNGNASPDCNNEQHFMLSSSQVSTSIPSSSDSSNIDLDNLDDQRQLFNHILDELGVFDQNLEKEMNSNSILNKTLKYVEGKYCETKKKL